MEALTGFNFDIDTNGMRLHAQLVDNPKKSFGLHQHQAPAFIPHAEHKEIIAKYVGSDTIAMAEKKFTNWTSLYCGTTGIPAPILRNAFKNHGIHIYCDTNDNVMASDSLLSIHTITPGLKKISLPRPCKVTDIINNRLIGQNITEFTDELDHNQTAIYILE